MSLANLPSPIAAFVTATNARDTAALCATLSDNAVLVDQGREYRGEAITEWAQHLFQGAPVAIHPINMARRDGKIVVTVMATACSSEVGSGQDRCQPRQLDWWFTITDGKICAVAMIQEALPDLPEPVAAYIQAMNTFNLDAFLATFADDALVNDQLRDYWGKSAIREWATRDIIGDRVTMYVVKVVEHYGHAILTANVDGDYDKKGLPDPLVLAFYFSTRRDKIVQLIILHNHSEI
jgi:hypothetical protein